MHNISIIETNVKYAAFSPLSCYDSDMKVAIAWYGAEGQSNYRYYTERGHDVTIVTPRISPKFPAPDGAKVIVGDDALSRAHLRDFDLVVRSSSIRPDSLQTNGRVWSATNEFFAQCPAPIIGVTGTKGKGTTCGLIASILRAASKTVHLVGNIGTPPLDVLPQVQPTDLVVFELSSFQLWDLEKSPHVAVVLMIEPDHLDVHRSFDEYIEAKANICHNQQGADFCVYHPTNPYARQIALSSGGQGEAYRYAIPDDYQVYVDGVYFASQNRRVCPVDALRLPGAHNLENACAAMSAVALAAPGLSPDVYDRGLREFTGLPHRLKFVAEKNGVAYYDDSIATTPGSAIAALRAFGQGKTIILGGSDKGADYDEVIDECLRAGARVVAIGQTGEKIEQLCRQHGVAVVREFGSMKQVVAAAAQLSSPGDVVILSPASASFDQYSNYSDRGDQFVAAVEEL